ncbi:MAG: SMC-Scp complex subunit ScpB [Clostridia bacterium]|nr:SMC-Scp complex subunit ScpB [Clostridia bacterium]
MNGNEALYAKIECLLFVSGEPVPVTELARVLGLSKPQTASVLKSMEKEYTASERGVLPFVTEDTVQLISNRAYIGLVEDLLQPEKSRNVSKSMLETLAVVAYRQPCTRADIEEVRGVRCEYAVSKLTELGYITEVGRKDTLGHPVLFGTTDLFLRKFGLHSLDELKDFSDFTAFPEQKV